MLRMASVKSFNLLCVCVFCLSCYLIPVQCYGNNCLPEEHVALFIFGDSRYDAGNNNYINTIPLAQANYPPYGETFFKFPTGRFCDGRLIPDFIAEYANLPFVPPYSFPGNTNNIQSYVRGVNFASAGAGALVGTRKGLVEDLKTQFRNLEKVEELLTQKLGHEATKRLLSRAVYLFSIGDNDYYTAPFINNPSLLNKDSPQKYVEAVIGNLTEVIKGVYEKGGKKFGFLNLGPLGCFPVVRARQKGGACVYPLSALARLHNSQLSMSLSRLASKLTGFKYSVTDFYNPVVEFTQNPSKYGFKEGNAACCGNGVFRGNFTCGGKRAARKYELCENVSDYVFFDSAHLTDKAHEYLAQLMWSGNQNQSGPYNVRALFEDK